MRVVVVGAGLVGLSTAWALVRAGHTPVVYDAAPIPNPNSASHDQHRIIRRAYGDKDGYGVMVEHAFDAWNTLWADLGETHYVETGTAFLHSASGDWAEACRAGFDRLGVPYEILDHRSLSRRCPFLQITQDTWAFYDSKGGVLLADRILGALVEWLSSKGVELHAHETIQEVDGAQCTAVLANGDRVMGDAVAIAVGAWAPWLCPDVASRVEAQRQFVVYLEPPTAFADTWRDAPVIVDFGGQNDTWAIPPVSGTGLKIGAGVHRRSGDPTGSRDAEPGEATRVLDYFSTHLKDLSSYRVSRGEVCFYGWSTHEQFVVNATPRTVLVSGCSGHMFKFGALIGLETARLFDGIVSPEEFTRWLSGTVISSN